LPPAFSSLALGYNLLNELCANESALERDNERLKEELRNGRFVLPEAAAKAATYKRNFKEGGLVNARNHFELRRRIVHILSRHMRQELRPERRLLLGGAAALAIAIPLALGTAGCASKDGTHGAEASNGQHPSFKAASIKRNDDTAWCCAIDTRPKDRFVATESALGMIMLAYGEQRPLKPSQVFGGPDWMKTGVFTIDAELSKSLSDQLQPPFRSAGPPLSYPPEVRQADALKQLFRSLLIDRFKLRIEHETKELPVYELVLAKNGPKIAEDKTADRSCRITDIGPGKGRWLDVKSCDFPAFAGVLSAIPDLRSRVLVDKTDLQGRYSFQLHWTPGNPPGIPKPAMGSQRNQSAAPAEPSGPSLFTALREQLGLKVQSTTAPVPAVLIQHIENPAKN
jgi:bla regulator protein blaR1